MSQTNTIKSKIQKNPLLFISIMQIVMFIFPGYSAKDEFVGDSASQSLFKAAFDTFGGINIVLQLFIIISPIATLIILFVKKAENKQNLILKIADVMGIIGCIFLIITIFTMKGKADEDISVNIGFGLWGSLILYACESYIIFFKNKLKKEEN